MPVRMVHNVTWVTGRNRGELMDYVRYVPECLSRLLSAFVYVHFATFAECIASQAS